MSKAKFITLDRSLNEFDFSDNPVFFGMYIETVKLGVGSPAKPEGFEMHVFTDLKTGEDVTLSTTHTIDKLVEFLKRTPEKMACRIEWHGKTEVKGKPFHRFSTSYLPLSDFDPSDF